MMRRERGRVIGNAGAPRSGQRPRTRAHTATARTETADRCPCRLRGVPTPHRVRMKRPKLNPPTWMHNRFRIFACPRRCVRRIPPVL